MKNDFTKEKDQLMSIVDQHFMSILEQKLEAHISFIETVQVLHKRFANVRFDQQESSDIIHRIKKYKQDLIPVVENHFATQEPASFDVQFPSFIQAVDNYIEPLDERILRIQEPERFTSQPEDSAFVKTGKGFKRACFALSKIPEQMVNLFRKVGNKNPQPLKGWTHRIDYKNLTKFYLKELLSQRVESLLNRIHERKCATSLFVWKADKEIVAKVEAFLTSETPFILDESAIELSEQGIGSLRAEKEIIRKELSEIFEQTHNEYESAFYKAGTFELSNRRFNRVAILKKHKGLQKETINIEKGWKVTWQVLRDDWQIDNELYHLLFSVFNEFFASVIALKSSRDSNIITSLDEIRDYLTGLKKRIEQVQHIASQKKIIEDEKEAVVPILMNQMLPAINDQILSQNFPSLMAQVEAITDQLIQQISTKRSIIKNPDFTAPIRSSLISFISPYELITFESWPQLLKVIKQIKINLIERLAKVQNSISDLGQIVLFNLESALEFDAEASSASSPKAIASEGLDRSLERLAEIKKALSGLDELWEKDLFQGLLTFGEKLIKLTDNNNITELRVRIAKGKAIKRGRLIRKQFVRMVRNFFPLATRSIKRLLQEARQIVKGTFKKYGIAAKPDRITTEIADFLAETQQSAQKLPYVYQRLFKIEPLSDPNFFIGRVKEVQSLNNAFNNWLKGRFAATIIIGEQGSGVTSLANIFQRTLPEGVPVVHFKADSTISTKTELYNFLNFLFKQKINQLSEWADYLNALEKQVVIFEDIQCLYLKKVNGFDALKELTELISLTSRNIFWIMTCTEYAFTYLDKTILLSDHFSYFIRLDLFDDETMVDIIKRRHTVSGYNIHYEPAPSDLISKKFKKLTDEEKQTVLQREYFSDLNKNVKSNISLALTYWLRSVIEVSGNTILIRSLKDIDLSFLNSLSPPKLFVLSAFILHERLTEENLGKVLHINTVEARRLIQPLYEDGILISTDIYFSVNPLLYIKTITLLKNKNIIH
ncbi:MAG: ATP-binding protein [Bacteroidota bacterium]